MTLALRRLLKNPGFTIIAVLTLALGIGLSTGMFATFVMLVLQPSISPAADELVSLFRTSNQSRTLYAAPADFADFAKSDASFARIAAYTQTSVNLSEPGRPAERLFGMGSSADFFSVFGIAPELGRTFTAAEDRAGGAAVAVLSDRFWRHHFNADPTVVGRTVRMNGQPTTIVGVMPDSFENTLVWGPIDLFQPLAYDAATWNIRDNHWLQIIGRLKPGMPLARAQAEATAIAARLAHDHPQTNAGGGLNLVAWNEQRRGSQLTQSINWLGLSMAGFVLLIACANLANLQLAQVAGRLREFAVRLALGASRWQLVRQVLSESLLVSLAGGFLGLFLAAGSVSVIQRELIINGQGDLVKIPINGVVLLYALVLSVGAGLLLGIVPALVASRTQVGEALKDNSRSSAGGRGQHRMRNTLVAGELALAVILVAGAGYFVRGIIRFAQVDRGWQPDGLLTASLVIPFNGPYVDDAHCRDFLKKLEASLAELPGVRSSAISANLPIVGFWTETPTIVEGRPLPAPGREPSVYVDPVTPEYFSALGMRLLAGRTFTTEDREGKRPVVVINESMARKLWPGENPIGQRIGAANPDHRQWLEVVGVVNDVHPALELVQPPATPFQTYLPLRQAQGNTVHWINLAVRSTAPESVVAQALRQAVTNLDSDLPVYGLDTARGAIRQSITSSFILFAKILGVYAVFGLLLSAIGIYGVIAHLITQRTREIGIRMALGAQARDVLTLVLGQGVLLTALGAGLGLAGSFALVRLLEAIMPGLPDTAGATLGTTIVLLSGVALLACWLPARRATKIDPIIALRAE